MGSDSETKILEEEGHQPHQSSSASPEHSDEEIRAARIVQAQPKKSWKSYVWDTLDKSPEERRFLFKLDTVLLTFASLGYFIKYLDQVASLRSYFDPVLH